MSAGSKIQDSDQEYQYSQPFVTPSGHEFSFYDTPDNERLVVKHTSGSHIEFKADGSIFIKAAKDLHTHASVNSSGSADGAAKGADNSTLRYDTDHTLDVGGRLRIKCSELDFEIGSTGRIVAGTDLIMSSNNMINKATESISIEGQKSVYLDTKEMRERVVSRQTEAGTMEDGSPGGLNVMKVHGNTVIQNDDANGGITIASKGYLNLVAGAERVDLVGKFTTQPSDEAAGTFTTKVYASSGSMDVSSKPGDYIFESEAGASYTYAKETGGSSASPQDGLSVQVQTGDDTYELTEGDESRSVAVGDQTLHVEGDRTRTVNGQESVTIVGDQTIQAANIYLN
jgi:hypothetical protein